MKKKGSLNLSIEVIVVVVIAFVVLGLGLGFVRSQFKQISETSSAVQEQIKQSILDDLRTGEKKLSFPASEIKLGRLESSVTAFGIKNNNANDLKYQVKVTYGGTGQQGQQGQEVISGDGFLYTEAVETLGPAEVRVIPLRITAGTPTGTGLYKITILDVTNPNPSEIKDYDSKTFFITVTG